MFIIENGKIQGQKSLNIGKIRVINLAFKGDFAFADDDKFKLSIGAVQSDNFGFTNDGCISFNYVDVTKLITATTNSKAITITKNGTQILSDTLTIVADYSGGGGGSLPDGIVVTNEQGTIDNCLLNKSFHNYGTLDANIYLDFTKAVSFIVLQDLSCLTFLSNGCNDQTNLSTTEIWIKPNGTTIDTISYDSRIQLIGDMPTSFSADDDVNTVYVFVARYYYNNDDIIVMNYSHKFIDNWYNRDQQ